ncbi:MULTISPECIES: hypothetical protein [unclassified Caballeronia]|uniref:hypothetical protein n=1 Tax=unclassified Caballeronia TaxID=2646786 RepID=UPI00285EFD1F|nr:MULTISPECIES: hypothetical protein [unclassified Caballeronia]MDR5772078.1 hypothetical protein [Caballeronia sp. LZ002]MDR5847512.1 hypothetical protein [Caballeronia sp. LZ003]
MCVPVESATTGSGAPYGFGGSSASPSVVTPGNATLALGAAGGALKLFSALTTAGATRTAEDAQADAAATNALIAERAAASAISSGQAQASDVSIRGAQTIATQRAALAANGVDLNSGTAASLQASTKYVTDQNVDTITANAARAAMGYTTQSNDYADKAGSLRAAAGSVSSVTAGATSLLTSATSVASDWYRNQRVGVV